MISFETQPALLSLSLLSMTALTLTDQRRVAAGTATAGEPGEVEAA